jgi:hypothetical protein
VVGGSEALHGRDDRADEPPALDTGADVLDRLDGEKDILRVDAFGHQRPEGVQAVRLLALGHPLGQLHADRFGHAQISCW